MRDRASHKPVVKAIEPVLALLFNRGFFLFGRSLDVITQEWNKSHRYDERAKQRSGHDNGQAAKELTGITCQHQERKIGDDVGDRGKEDCCRQLRGTQPGRDIARQAFCETSLDAVAGDHRHIHQKSQSNDERGHRNLLEIDTQHVNNTEGHSERDGNGQGHDEREPPLPEANQ